MKVYVYAKPCICSFICSSSKPETTKMSINRHGADIQRNTTRLKGTDYQYSNNMDKSQDNHTE